MKLALTLTTLLLAFALVGCQNPTTTNSISSSDSSAKSIKAFGLVSPTAKATIVGTNIGITVPVGTDLTTLVATFTTTGASVSVGSTPQISGTTTNDFTLPVDYEVTAADGSTQTYTVTVAPSSEKAITAFTFASPAATGIITGTHIDVVLPQGSSLTNLAASFTTTGTSVKVNGVTQISGVTTRSFASPVSYVVTAADNTAQTYTVTVTVATTSSMAITGFSFASPAATGTISGTSISVVVPYGTPLNPMVASFTTTGASVAVGSKLQVSGTTANNFTSPVSYLVTAEDGSTQTYTVTVTAPSPAKAITGFSFTSPAVTGTISGTSISVVVPKGTAVTALVASFTTTGASVAVDSTVQVSGASSNNFTLPVSYVVTAADGSTQTYTVTVTSTLWTNYTTANGLGNNWVFNVCVSGSTIYAATLGGVSVSTNGGTSWTNYSTANGLGGNLVGGVCVSGSTIYAATDGGVSVSTNGGSSWTNYTTANGLGGNLVDCVYVSGSTIYAANDDAGVSVSTNGGTTWTNFTTANGLGSIFYCGQECKAVRGVCVSGSTIYAATGGGVSVSTNGGTIWTNYATATGLGSQNVYGVCVSGSTIYAATGDGVSVSTNGGTTWTKFTTANDCPGSGLVNGVYASGSTIYAATGGGLSVSTNGGTNWTTFTTANGLGDDDVNGVFVSGSTIYAATSGGVSISH